MTIDTAIVGYLAITLLCALPLRVAGAPWRYAITRAAMIPAVLAFAWVFVALTLAL
jgi:hypothetical protein